MDENRSIGLNAHSRRLLGSPETQDPEDLVKVVGKHASVTYDILTDDHETEEILQAVLSTQINALVNEDKNKLRSIIGAATAPKKKIKSVEGDAQAEFHRKENLEAPELIALGGQWAYSVALMADDSGKSVRIAKGKIRGNYYRDHATGEMVLQPDDPMNPISLVNKINIKRLSEWEKLQTPVVVRLTAIEESRK